MAIEVFEGIRQIVEQDFDLLISCDWQRYHYDIRALYTTNLIRDSHYKLLDLPLGMFHHTVDVARTRCDDGHQISTQASLLQYGQRVVPLGTHAIRDRKREFKSYELTSDYQGVLRSQPLDEFILEELPDVVQLTRVLSVEEAQKYAQRAPNLGSTRKPFWENVVHTAVHNITSEFTNQKGYEYYVKFLIEKAKLAQLNEQELVELGTYDWLFKIRGRRTPLPFEVEVIFKSAAFSDLLEAYQRWRVSVGADYIGNPFMRYSEPN